MRRFVFTSQHFNGTVEAIYNLNGVLWRIDFSTAKYISNEYIKGFKTRIPVQIENLEAAFADTTVKVTEKDFEVSFDDFKREYPYKRNMHLAEKHWPRLVSSKQFLAFLAAIEYRQHCEAKGLDKQYIMLPEKFLKTEQWKNDWKNM